MSLVSSIGGGAPKSLRWDAPRPGVKVLTLNRPERLNALSWELVDEITKALALLKSDADCRVLVVTGAGRGFCSGLDLKMDDPLSDSLVTFMERQERLAAIVSALRALPVPVIAAVNGPAAGGGFALALACDLRICSESATFSAAFIRIGLSACDMGTSYLLPRLVGTGVASELMLTGREIDADYALKVGVVTQVLSGDVLMDEALKLASEIMANTPFGVRMTKEVLAINLDAPSLSAALALENRTQFLASRTLDAKQMLQSFADKRTRSVKVSDDGN
jgi:enoyl-CoA hydratase